MDQAGGPCAGPLSRLVHYHVDEDEAAETRLVHDRVEVFEYVCLLGRVDVLPYKRVDVEVEVSGSVETGAKEIIHWRIMLLVVVGHEHHEDPVKQCHDQVADDFIADAVEQRRDGRRCME